MNVASLELCKELYELSGWKTGGDKPTWNGRKGVNSAPAYDLSYLLRKLNATGYVELRTRGNQQDAWVCTYEAHSDEGETRSIKQAETPENATVLVAIELLKQGVLTSERLAPQGESKLGGTEET